MKQISYGVVGKENRFVTVYKRPSILSPKVTYLYPGDLVVIDETQSTECYYKVQSDNGADGYCIQSAIERKDTGYGP